MIYLDNSATTPPYPEVVEVYAKALKEYYGNPSSLHHLGAEAEKVLNGAREVAAGILRVKPQEIFFISGGTEGNNLSIFGVARQYANRGKHLITSRIEHPSVLECFRRLEGEGYQVTYLPVDRDGRVRVDELKRAIRKDTILVSIMHVNNEIGSVQPIAEIGAILKEYPKIFFHVDAVQSFGKIPMDVKGWGIDLLTLSGHKFHGPKGVGLLYKSERVQLHPLIVGGGQEDGVRSGTQNVPGIIAFTKAMRMSHERMGEFNRVGQLKMRLWEMIKEIPGVRLNSPLEAGAPHILNISAVGIKPEVLLHALDEKGIMVSTKSACSSKADKVSHVLKALELPPEQAGSAIRISLSAMNTLEEMEYTAKCLKEIVPQLQKLAKV